MALAVSVLLSVGFFIADSTGSVGATSAHQKGLVVFTGGTNRIEEGAKIILSGYTGPVLITGVYPGVQVEQLFKAYGLSANQLASVTLDYAAQSTAGNVLQTGRWAREHHITDLRVITSSYHAARSRLLFRRYTPDLRVAISPVEPDSGGLRIWVKEYIKYALVLVGAEAFMPAIHDVNA